MVISSTGWEFPRVPVGRIRSRTSSAPRGQFSQLMHGRNSRARLCYPRQTVPTGHTFAAFSTQSAGRTSADPRGRHGIQSTGVRSGGCRDSSSVVVRIETVFCLINLTSELSLVLPDSVLDMIAITSDTRLTPFKFNRECEPMRILVAENDVPLADFLCQKLQAEQFTVELIPGTREAEHLVAERPCDLALLDLALPYAAGIDTLRHIRAKKPELPLVFLTSLENVDERALP